ncbi:MAG: D-2-hydroxyacid dehydrogenase [Sulfurospirillum sp.]|nr:D-2-hydroxyacid dehydrogenase [Sulfurospirillum sp.]
MKIVFLDALTLGNDADLRVLGEFGEFISYDTTTLDERLMHIGDAQIVLSNKVVIDKVIMDACKNLKLICITATGMNNVDLEYAKQKGIVVKNVAGYSTASVAQATFAHALALISSGAYYDAYVKNGNWSKSPIFTHLDKPIFEINRKTWGIIGLGAIGKEVAKIATAFGANIVFYSTSGVNNDSLYKRVPLEELMQSDIISIHAPLNDKTNGLIKKEQLSLMKQGGILLNMGRGGIVDEQDLALAIDTQDIFAGLDVMAIEPPASNNPLLHVRRKERLILSPHVAWASVEARKTLITMVSENIKKFLA